MLAATTAHMLSIDSEVVSATMGEGYNINVKSSPSGEDQSDVYYRLVSLETA